MVYDCILIRYGEMALKGNNKRDFIKKLSDNISFPDILNMTPYMTSGSAQYRLMSVIVHSGSAGGGHYYTYVWDSETNKWHLRDDSYAGEATISSSDDFYGRGGTPYILVYGKI